MSLEFKTHNHTDSLIAKVKMLTLELTEVKTTKRKTFSLDWKIAVLMRNLKRGLFFHLKFSFDCWVEMVFNVIICSSRQILCNFSPFVTIFSMSSNDYLIFLRRPFTSLDLWIKMIMPSLSTLFTYSARKITRYNAPILRSVFFN